jgi:anti-anti-sigma regulatory factor
MPLHDGKTTRVVTLQGVVDAEAARRVRDTVLAVLRLGRGERVVVDCRKVRQIEDAVLALLAVSVQVADERVTILGLADRQRRLLHYLDLPAVTARPSPARATRAPRRSRSEPAPGSSGPS